VTQAQYELSKGTNMFDYAKRLFEQLHPDEEVPAGMKAFLLLFFFLMLRMMTFRV